MLYIFLMPIIGLAVAFVINLLFPHAQFRGYDVLPFFFIAGCNLITAHMNQPSFLPYGFLIYFILVIVVSLNDAIKNKNISLSKTFLHNTQSSKNIYFLERKICLLLQ